MQVIDNETKSFNITRHKSQYPDKHSSLVCSKVKKNLHLNVIFNDKILTTLLKRVWSRKIFRATSLSNFRKTKKAIYCSHLVFIIQESTTGKSFQQVDSKAAFYSFR